MAGKKQYQGVETIKAIEELSQSLLLSEDTMPSELICLVISFPEEQSDEECAILLRCSRRDVLMARLLALKRQSSTAALAGETLQS
jgi:hypothetical protein